MLQRISAKEARGLAPNSTEGWCLVDDARTRDAPRSHAPRPGRLVHRQLVDVWSQRFGIVSTVVARLRRPRSHTAFDVGLWIVTAFMIVFHESKRPHTRRALSKTILRNSRRVCRHAVECQVRTSRCRRGTIHMGPRRRARAGARHATTQKNRVRSARTSCTSNVFVSLPTTPNMR